jgi:hypothetical protein
MMSKVQSGLIPQVLPVARNGQREAILPRVVSIKQGTVTASLILRKHGDAKPLVLAPMMADEGHIRPRERTHANQRALIVGKRKQLRAFGGRQHLASRLDSSKALGSIFFI